MGFNAVGEICSGGSLAEGVAEGVAIVYAFADVIAI